MKNFARVIDLGNADCCVHRQGKSDIIFDFWMRIDGHVLSPSCTKNYHHSWVVDQLFGEYESRLTDEAEQVLDMVLHQMDLHAEQLDRNETVVLDGDTLNQIHSEE